MATPRVGSPAQMPPAPNREDAAATYANTPRVPYLPTAAVAVLTFPSWKYLEAGIDRIMLHLEHGIDMQTVRGDLGTPTADD